MPKAEFIQTELTEFFEYLDNLRVSGVTNMYGAGQYLCDEFDMSETVASSIVSHWIETFNLDETASERARKVK